MMNSKVKMKAKEKKCRVKAYMRGKDTVQSRPLTADNVQRKPHENEKIEKNKICRKGKFKARPKSREKINRNSRKKA